MNEFIGLSFIVGGVFAFLILLARKWKVEERYSNSRFYAKYRYAPPYCEFCFTFWGAFLALTACVFIFEMNFVYLLTPFLATPIAYKFVN